MHGGSNPNSKAPISTELMYIMANKIDKNNQEQIELISMCSLCFYGFLRIAECTALNRNDLVVTDELITILIRSSKTDQEGKGLPVYIQKSETPYSPFKWIPLHLDKHHFGTKLFSMSNQLFRARLHNFLMELGIQCQNISSHSFRKGGTCSFSPRNTRLSNKGTWKIVFHVFY